MEILRIDVSDELTPPEKQEVKKWLKGLEESIFFVGDEWFKKEEHKLFFRLFKSNTLIGVYSCRVVPYKKTINGRGIIISPHHRGLKYGTLLLREAINYLAKEYKGFEMKVVVHPENIASLKLMLSLGFKVYGYISDFKNTGEPRIKLKMILL